MAAIWSEGVLKQLLRPTPFILYVVAGHLRGEYTIVDTGHSVTQVERGRDWYAVHFAKCNRDLLSPQLHQEFCAK